MTTTKPMNGRRQLGSQRRSLPVGISRLAGAFQLDPRRSPRLTVNSVGMIMFVATVVASCFTSFVIAEDAKPTVDLGALFKMHFTNRVRAFKEQNEQLRYVVLLGDSITEGFDTEKYLPGRRVLNRGIGADVIGNALPEDDRRGILRRMNESIFDCA